MSVDRSVRYHINQVFLDIVKQYKTEENLTDQEIADRIFIGTASVEEGEKVKALRILKSIALTENREENRNIARGMKVRGMTVSEISKDLEVHISMVRVWLKEI